VSPALPVLSGAQAVVALTKAGFEQQAREAVTSSFETPAGRVVIVPLHRELAIGTLRSVIR
jgi:predicted RNA binding protein YcfA (HicA-like mRNA interferase family)